LRDYLGIIRPFDSICVFKVLEFLTNISILN
jgi:hypothetical protein